MNIDAGVPVASDCHRGDWYRWASESFSECCPRGARRGSIRSKRCATSSTAARLHYIRANDDGRRSRDRRAPRRRRADLRRDAHPRREARPDALAIIDLTAGELGTRGSADLRGEGSVRAAAVLGVAARENLGLPGRRRYEHSGDARAARGRDPPVRAAVVIAPSLTGRHPDHAVTAQLVRDACFVAGLKKIEPERAAAPATEGRFTASRTVRTAEADIRRRHHRRVRAEARSDSLLLVAVR